MRLTRIVTIATVSLTLNALALPSSAQTDEEKAAARALATQGAQALSENKFAEALDLVTRAEAVVHAPPHLLMMGRAQVGLGRLVAARETFLKITREQLAATAPNAFKKAQQDAQTELSAIEPKIASLRIVLKGPGAADPSKVTVKLDDQPVSSALVGVHRPIDPGKHVIGAFVTGRSPVTQEVTLADAEKKEIELEVDTPTTLPDVAPIDPDKQQKPPPPKGMSPLRLAGIAGMGVGGAGLILGGVFLGLGASKQGEADDMFAKCEPNCTPAQKKGIETLDSDAAGKSTIGVVGLVAGGVLAGAGVALFLLGAPKKEQAKPTTSFVMPFVTPNGGGLFGTF